MSALYSVSDIQRILDPIFTAHGVRRAVLFGSYAKGCATAQSDIDLLVDSGLRGLSFFGLLESVSSAFRQPVDLIDVTQVENGLEIPKEIHDSGVRIFESPGI